jgi:6-phosphofructokinase 1
MTFMNDSSHHDPFSHTELTRSGSKTRGAFGIIVSGGPAPGINSVISSATIEARNRGFTVKGFKEGFQGIALREPDSVTELTIEQVSSISSTGGSLLGTSRFNPFRSAGTKEQFLRGLHENNIDKLIVIGGEGSAYLSHQLARENHGIQVIHVPKTIDNDLILPNHYPSFGFETARYAGTKILDTLRVDARTTKRWFLVTTMGRKAGFLALGLGIASGATLTLVPEEFRQGTTPQEVAQVIFGSLQRRFLSGRDWGVIVIAEGVLDLLSPESSKELRECPRDELGRIKYSQIELGDVIKPELQRLCDSVGHPLRLNTKNIGYELRCHPPVSFDVEYTKFLGFGAVRHLLEGKTDGMVTRTHDALGFQPLSELVLPDGSIRSRTIDLDSDLYRVARSFMIR